MRRIRFFAFALISFITALVAVIFTPGTFLNRAVATALCTVFSFNSTACIASLARSSERVVAANPPAVERTIADGFGDLLVQRSREFDDDPKTPTPGGNPNVPPYPQQPSPDTPVRPEFDSIGSSPDKRRLEARSRLNEKLLVEIVSPALMTMNYTDWQGIELFFRVERTGALSSLQTLSIGQNFNIKKQTKEVVGLANPSTSFSYPRISFTNYESRFKEKYNNEIADLIDPNLEPGSLSCFACNAITDMLDKFKDAKDFDSLLNTKIPATYKITQLLIRGDFLGAVWKSFEQLDKSIRSKLQINPLKALLKGLYDKALNCSLDFVKQCQAPQQPKPAPQPLPPPQPSLNPSPRQLNSKMCPKDDELCNHCAYFGSAVRFGESFPNCRPYEGYERYHE